MEETIVKEWLCSLKMGQYADSFMDNGYDDLEICKQIDTPDLDAIGVVNPCHRSIIIQAVQILRVEGAASVYFTVEEAQAQLETASRNSDPGPCYEHCKIYQSSESAASTPGDANQLIMGLCSTDLDAYEAGKAELVRLPQLQLKQLLTENLKADNINLTVHPYTLMEGKRGFIEGLASRYADKLNTHYQDVLEHLEYLRLQDWNSLSVKMAHNNKQIYQYLISENPDSQFSDWSPRSCASSSHEPDDSQPIYLPGKYNPSSCLSDAEEDQIYGFTGRNPVPASSVAITGCLNPRSEKIYELPPIRVQKKKIGLGKFLRTLKKDFRRAADSKSKHFVAETLAASRKLPEPVVASDLSSTPLVVLPGYSSPTSSHCSQSSKSHSSNQSFIVSSASAPGTPGASGSMRDSGIQIAIEKLKEQEIKKRREDQFRDHEQMLKDIKHGLEQAQKMENRLAHKRNSRRKDTSGVGQQESRRGERRHGGNALMQHWYDEPPYESDPEDFLIGKEIYREVNFKGDKRHWPDEDVISLKTAGDITLSREGLSIDTNGGSKSAINVNPGCDLQSVSSQLSCLTVGTRARQAPRQDTTNSSNEATPSCQRKYSASLVGRMKSLQKDMQKRVSRLTGSRENIHELPNKHKTPTAFTLLYQRQNSLPVKLKSGPGLPTTMHYPVVVNDSLVFPIIGRGVAVEDCFPPTYDKAALNFKKGDVIDIISKSPTGLWKGHVHGKVGFFRFRLVDELSCSLNHGNICEMPPCLNSLLMSLQLGHLTQVFLVNGIETMEHFMSLRSENLDMLGITNKEVRTKLLSAVAWLLSMKEPHITGETSFIRRTNGRITMPPGGPTSHPYGSYHNSGFIGSSHKVRSPLTDLALYENTRTLVLAEENNLDSKISQNEINYCGGRPFFNIPLVCKSSSEELKVCQNKMSMESEANLQQVQASIETANEDCHPSGSYHAQVAMVEEAASIALANSNHE